jgi:hypothetical protein
MGAVLLLGALPLHATGVALAGDGPGGTPSGRGGAGVHGTVPGGTLSGRGGVGVRGMVPGGTPSDLGGVGVPGDVPGGTLSDLGGVGVPGMVPGGTLGPPPTGAQTSPFFPGLVVPEPAPLPGFGFGGPVEDPAAQWPQVRAWRGGRAGTVHR